MKELTPRATIAQYVREYVADEDEVIFSVLVSDVLEHFGADAKFMAEFHSWAMRTAVDEIVREVMQSGRRRVHVGDDLLPREAITERAEKHSVFGQWLEKVKDRHIKLMEMTREDLLAVALVRQQRGERQLEIAALFRKIADGLEGGQTVGSRYTEEEIEAMKESLKPLVIA